MKKWLWIILGFSLVITLPSIYERHSEEKSNNLYETILPYHEIAELIDGGLNKRTVFEELKNSGLTSISLEAETLKLLEQFGKVSLLNREQFLELVIASNSKIDLPKERGTYVFINEEEYFDVEPSITRIFPDIQLIEHNNHNYYFIPGNPEYIEELPLGYSSEAITEITRANFNLIPRFPENMYITNSNEFIFKQLVEIKGPLVTKLLPSGKEIVGYPDNMSKWANEFRKIGYTILSTEFNEQKGFTTYAYMMDLNVVRLHSLEMEERTESQIIDTAIRAVKERNIRALFLHLYADDSNENNFKDSTLLLSKITKSMPTQFNLGNASTFQLDNQSIWEKTFVIFGIVVFIILFAKSILDRRLGILSVGITIFLSIFYLVSGISILAKILALLVAIVTAIYASIPQVDARNMILNYVRSILLSIIGIWLLVTLLYGNEYLSHVGSGFRGVKLLYTLPILFVIFYVLTIYAKQDRYKLSKFILWLKAPVKYWHLILLGILAITGLYYISRTGNAASVSSYELFFRQKLEELLYVRPRTKEFLIGFPLFLVGIYLIQHGKKLGYILLIPGSIGWLSFVNTFTHLHIPLHISLLRSLYSLALGLVVGGVYILLYRTGIYYYSKVKRKVER
ncbi:DUF5693 family protein [Bacillus suaedaesalsae]|uniref:Uncharacterized protein n=1 Tax=Bacillus suaedaesalsae TaxID=2810349 RepID=A0ABS2DKP5_9BACI|nr:DUF5693 family protein [Bacillus suaedaesalsae]MBM6619074.1 hypothetical protein [Bacillus suaedaesalsae]